jgi:hypothetical protein
MFLFLFILLYGVLFVFSNNRAITSANMNMYMDIVMIQVGPWMNANLIPMAMPDVTEEFSAVSKCIIFIIHFWTSLVSSLEIGKYIFSLRGPQIQGASWEKSHLLIWPVRPCMQVIMRHWTT